MPVGCVAVKNKNSTQHLKFGHTHPGNPQPSKTGKKNFVSKVFNVTEIERVIRSEWSFWLTNRKNEQHP